MPCRVRGEKQPWRREELEGGLSDGRMAGAGQVGLPAEKFYPRGRISDSSRREKWGTKDGRQEINSEATMTANASFNADTR